MSALAGVLNVDSRLKLAMLGAGSTCWYCTCAWESAGVAGTCSTGDGTD